MTDSIRPSATAILARFAVEPSKRETETLTAILSRYLGGPFALQTEIDPSIIGGLWIRIGDQVIDGSLSGRLEMLRHHLRAQSRIAASTPSMGPTIQPPLVDQ